VYGATATRRAADPRFNEKLPSVGSPHLSTFSYVTVTSGGTGPMSFSLLVTRCGLKSIPGPGRIFPDAIGNRIGNGIPEIEHLKIDLVYDKNRRGAKPGESSGSPEFRGLRNVLRSVSLSLCDQRERGHTFLLNET